MRLATRPPKCQAKHANCGKALQLCADTTNLVRHRTAESPFAVLGIVAAIGFIAGATWAKSRQIFFRTYLRDSGSDGKAY
jgi:hypothetical protein